MTTLPWFQPPSISEQGPQFDPYTMQQLSAAQQSGGQGLANAQQAQQQSMDQWAQMAAGNGPSLAQEMANQGASNAAASQAAMLGQARGGNVAAAGRQAAMAGAAANMGAQQQANQIRMQEQLGAMQAYGNQANTMANQNLQQQLASQQAMANAMSNQMNTQAQWGLGQRELDLQQREGNRGLGMKIANFIRG